LSAADHSAAFAVRRASWRNDEPVLRRIREAVFIAEQAVPEDLEWDEFDSCGLHVLAETPQGLPIATGRLTVDDHIGRMAVLPEWRGLGVGAAVLESLLAWAIDEQRQQIILHAQVHAMGFYRGFGFREFGAVFDEAGIAHQRMIKTLALTQ